MFKLLVLKGNKDLPVAFFLLHFGFWVAFWVLTLQTQKHLRMRRVAFYLLPCLLRSSSGFGSKMICFLGPDIQRDSRLPHLLHFFGLIS
jgi:hypothetical protein